MNSTNQDFWQTAKSGTESPRREAAIPSPVACSSGLRLNRASRPCPLSLAHKPRTDYKAILVQQCELVGLKMEPEFRFHPKRQFKADWLVHFAVWEGPKRPRKPTFVASRILIEFEGGIFSSGKRGHSSIRGILRDCEKANLAQILGYTIIRVAPNHVVSGAALRWIEDALKSESICVKCGETKGVSDVDERTNSRVHEV